MKKRGALKRLDCAGPEEKVWLAMLGPVVAVSYGRRMARLVALCSHFQELQKKAAVMASNASLSIRSAGNITRSRRVCERRFKRRFAPQLVALLWDSLATLNPERLDQLAAIIRRIRKHNEEKQSTLTFHDKALRLADMMRLKHEISSNERWPVTRHEFLKLLGVPEKDHDEGSYERRELKRLGIPFAPDKLGRKKETAKR